MAINQVAPLNAGDVAQAYSVPLEGVVDNLQQQQRLAIEQQRYAEQQALHRQQMDLQQQEALDNTLGSIHASGTAYDEYIRQKQSNLLKQVQDYRKKNPKDYIGAKSIANQGARNINYQSELAKGVADRAMAQIAALQKANPYYKTNELTADVLARAYKDEKGNFREMPDTNAIYGLNDMVASGKYIDQPVFDRTVRENFTKQYLPQESQIQFNERGFPMIQQVKAPFYKQYDQGTGKFVTQAQPIQYGDVVVNTLPGSVKRQLSGDPYLNTALPMIKQQLLNTDPRYGNLPPEALNEAALYNYVEKYGDAVPASLGNTGLDPAYAAQRQAKQDAFNNSMASQRLALQKEGLDMRKKRLKSQEEQLADANVFKDALTGSNRNGTTVQQQQQVFSKYQAPSPNVEMLNSFLKHYSRGKELAESYKTISEGGKKTFQAGNLARDLSPINISGAYTNAKVINPFTGQRGSAQLWVDPTDQSKTALVFLTLKDKKDDDGYSHSVPDYENLKVYEGDEAARFVDQIKDSEAKNGLQATDFIED